MEKSREIWGNPGIGWKEGFHQIPSYPQIPSGWKYPKGKQSLKVHGFDALEGQETLIRHRALKYLSYKTQDMFVRCFAENKHIALTNETLF
jgi:hypothetical protein